MLQHSYGLVVGMTGDGVNDGQFNDIKIIYSNHSLGFFFSQLRLFLVLSVVSQFQVTGSTFESLFKVHRFYTPSLDFYYDNHGMHWKRYLSNYVPTFLISCLRN